MKKLKRAALILSVVFTLPLYDHLSPAGTLAADGRSRGPAYAVPGKFDSYAEAWKTVKGFDEKGRPRSALEGVENILARAKKERNSPQIVKAQMHRVKYIMAIGEKEHPDIIRMLEQEMSAAAFPEKQILRSLLAEVYWNYFSAHRWTFYNRTDTAGLKEEDVSTWSLGKIMERIIALHRGALEGSDELKKIPLDLMNDILVRGTAPREYRPTLYDFLAHRAVDFFMIDENQLTRPAYDYEIDSAGYFGSAEDFAGMKVTARDATSLRYNAMVILQDLTRFHLKDAPADPSALVDVELKRLQFADDKAILPEKDSLYINALRALEKRFMAHRSSALVSYEIARWYRARGQEWKEGDPSDHQWSIVKSVDIARDVLKRFPDSEGALLCRPLTVIDKSLSLMTEKVNVPRRPFRALVKYKNLNRIYFRAVPLTEEEFEYLNASYESVNAKLDRLRNMKALQEWDSALPDDGDLRDHAVEVRVPPLEEGYYAILAGTDRSFSYNKNAAAYMATAVSNLSFVHRVSLKEGAVFYVLDRSTGEPLRDVSATITERSYDYTKSRYVTSAVAKLVSDNNGRVVFPMGGKDRYYSTLGIILRKGSDRLSSEFYSYAYGQGGRNPQQSYFFTDRSIYRPGQTIYFKGILLTLDTDRHYKIMPDQDTTVELYDYNNQKVGSARLRSNRYGTVSGSFTAPSGVLTGQMTIRNGSGSAVIRVEEYKRPRFEAGFEPVKGNYRLGERISVKGFARSYAGAPVSDAAVKYTVVRRIWFMYRWWGWYYWHYNGKETVMKKGEIKTDAGGAFTVDFEALPDKGIPPSEQPAFYYEVRADVTDINGETHGANAAVRAGYTALIVDIPNLPGIVDTTGALELELSTVNFSGEPVPVRGTLSMYRMKEPERLLRSRLWEKPDRFVMTKEEYVRNFPNDIYKDEDDAQARGVEKKYYSVPFDTGRTKKIAVGAIGSWPDGEYRVEIETTDAYGERIQYQRQVSLYAPKNGAVSRKAYVSITPLATTVEPGNNCSFLLASAADNAFLIFDIVRKGSVTEQKLVKLDGSKKIVAVPVGEEDRGNLHYRYAFIRDNRLFTGTGTINVPWTNKNLKAEFMTFRNRLNPGEKDEWRIKLTGPKGEMAAAELAASLYDASLDALYPHSWSFNVNPYFYNYEYWHSNSTFATEQSRLAANDWNEYYPSYSRYHDYLNLFGVYFFSRGKGYRYYKAGAKKDRDYSMAADELEETASDKKEAAPEAAKRKAAPAPPEPGQDREQSRSEAGKKETGEAAVQIRKNLNETAFFYPHLMTNEKGEVIVSFTAPEALTRWKVLGFAHTKDLKSVVFSNELVTQKELMVTPNVPRFLREGDEVFISSKISNMTDRKLSGTAELMLFDAATMKPLDRELSNDDRSAGFTVQEKGNAAVTWRIRIPESVEAVTWRIVARAGSFSDGEESTLPVLSNRMMVTESLPLPVRGKQTKNFNFARLVNSKSSSTLSHYRLTLEFTSNPAWYAVQALPYLMEFPHECSEQVFSRFYSNGLASHIVNSSPKIRAVFDRWKNSDALLSNLQKNEELKSVVLQETPWLLNGRNEEQNKKRVALLFDLNRMSRELDRAFSKLRQMQGANGGWPWFTGLPESWYITQHILAGLAKLNALGVVSASKDNISAMTSKAVAFIDGEMKRDYDYLIRHKINLKQKNIGHIQYHYLYTRSFFRDQEIPKSCREAFNYWKGQAAKYWPQEGPYAKGLAAIALHRFGVVKTAREIIESLRENAIYNEEMGMYWKENVGGYWWYQAPLETQALLIEAFSEVAGDRAAVDDMRTWLVKMKQVQHWGTTKATTDACYALLMGGSDWLGNDRVAEILLNDRKVDPAAMGATAEAGTGYFKVSWNRDGIAPEMGKVKVVNPNSNPAWGALYWQYFEQMDKITPHETPLKLEKKFFIVTSTDRGPVLEPVTGSTKLKPGDRLKVRIILRVDRDMDYVHMKDLRAAGTEPENVLSRRRHQDGLWYYESTKDTATHFFIERLPKGTFVFEYPLVVSLKGDFSAGITTIQCMYAPEFTSHSEGSRLRVE
ncbi:MAG TPA: alpha-2-macroglobulin family protein [Spirochaetota bacterium]|nr:alpha-2-macroglobulin family protein [Spirochaetota bacterium]